MLYPLSYGRSAASGIPVRNVAKDYRFTRLRRKSAPVRSWPSCQLTARLSALLQSLQRWPLGPQPLNLGHRLPQTVKPFIAVLAHQTHAPGKRFGS